MPTPPPAPSRPVAKLRARVPPSAALPAPASQPRPPPARGTYSRLVLAAALGAPATSTATPAGMVRLKGTGESRLATKPSTYSSPDACWYTTSTL
jgi:hypothetical protein